MPFRSSFSEHGLDFIDDALLGRADRSDTEKPAGSHRDLFGLMQEPIFQFRRRGIGKSLVNSDGVFHPGVPKFASWSMV